MTREVDVLKFQLDWSSAGTNDSESNLPPETQELLENVTDTSSAFAPKVACFVPVKPSVFLFDKCTFRSPMLLVKRSTFFAGREKTAATRIVPLRA